MRQGDEGNTCSDPDEPPSYKRKEHHVEANSHDPWLKEDMERHVFCVFGFLSAFPSLDIRFDERSLFHSRSGPTRAAPGRGPPRGFFGAGPPGGATKVSQEAGQHAREPVDPVDSCAVDREEEEAERDVKQDRWECNMDLHWVVVGDQCRHNYRSILRSILVLIFHTASVWVM